MHRGQHASGRLSLWIFAATWQSCPWSRSLMWSQNLENGSGKLGPSRAFALQVLASAPRQPVVLDLPVVLGDAPLGLQPTAPFLHAMQGRIQRALFEPQHVAGHIFEPAGNAEDPGGDFRGPSRRKSPPGSYWQDESLASRSFSSRC
jgi:hypothetical protein